jgi:hypothetical protein
MIIIAGTGFLGGGACTSGCRTGTGSIAGGTAGSGTGAGGLAGADVCSTGAPQFSQNFEPGGSSSPHEVQNAIHSFIAKDRVYFFWDEGDDAGDSDK